MSGGSNNFTPTRRHQQVGHDYGADSPNSSDWNSRQAPFHRFGSASFRASPDANRGAPRQSFEEGGMAVSAVPVPFSLAGVLGQSQSSVRIPILGNLMAREVRPRPRQIIQGSPPRFLVNRPNILPAQEDEQNAVLSKLKKEVYNPAPMNLAKRLSLYYRDQATNVYKEMQKQKEEDAMRCAVCLEDFEPKEKVMLTPCNHMFHEDCIVPWVKSNAQCPVCRFSLGENKRESRASDNNIANAAVSDEVFAMELVSVIRAMEESLLWNNAAR